MSSSPEVTPPGREALCSDRYFASSVSRRPPAKVTPKKRLCFERSDVRREKKNSEIPAGTEKHIVSPSQSLLAVASSEQVQAVVFQESGCEHPPYPGCTIVTWRASVVVRLGDNELLVVIA